MANHRDEDDDEPSIAGSRVEDCWCIDLCNRDHRRIEEFVHRTRGIVISSPTSPWFQYFDAVYEGLTPRPFELWRVDTFYQNTPKWRGTYPKSANPFRNCQGTAQERCAEDTCATWWKELTPQHSQIDSDVAVLLWPTWMNTWVDRYFHVCQLVSKTSSGLGHATYPNHTWVEVLRSDARPMFQEGAVPPECYQKGKNPFGLGEPRPQHGYLPSCYENLAPLGGGQPFLPGCWARPAVGSGMWINTGATMFPERLADITKTILFAANHGVETLQFEFGDEIPEYRPPWQTEARASLNPGLIILTHKECIGRTDGIKACIPGGPRGLSVRAGWHDLPCNCVDFEHAYHAWSDPAGEANFRENFGSDRGFVSMLPELPPPGELPETSGLLNCQPPFPPSPPSPPAPPFLPPHEPPALPLPPTPMPLLPPWGTPSPPSSPAAPSPAGFRPPLPPRRPQSTSSRIELSRGHASPPPVPGLSNDSAAICIVVAVIFCASCIATRRVMSKGSEGPHYSRVARQPDVVASLSERIDARRRDWLRRLKRFGGVALEPRAELTERRDSQLEQTAGSQPQTMAAEEEDDSYLL